MILILKFALQKLEFFGFFPILFFRTVMGHGPKMRVEKVLPEFEKWKIFL